MSDLKLVPLKFKVYRYIPNDALWIFNEGQKPDPFLAAHFEYVDTYTIFVELENE